jgi:hypothetical protein
MPLLESKSGGGYCAKATIKGAAVTFHLTPFGQKRLTEAGIQPGTKFPLALLADLARQGHAWTPPSVAEKTGINWAQQFDFNLAGDESAEPLFTCCADCNGYDDLHLAAWETKRAAAAKVLCRECRGKLPERFTLSVPLSLVTLAALTQMEAQNKLSAGNLTIASLRQSLAKDLSAEWEKFRQHQAHRQSGLGFEFGDELKLG